MYSKHPFRKGMLFLQRNKYKDFNVYLRIKRVRIRNKKIEFKVMFVRPVARHSTSWKVTNMLPTGWITPTKEKIEETMRINNIQKRSHMPSWF